MLLEIHQDDRDSFSSTGDYTDSDTDQDAQPQYSRNSRKKHRISDVDSQSGKENRRFDRHSYEMANLRNSTKKQTANTKGKGGKRKASPKNDADYASDVDPATNKPEENTEVAALKAKIAMLETTKDQAIASGKSKSEFTNEDKRWQGDVRQAVKKFVFGSVKFISTEKKLTKVAGKLAVKWNLRHFQGLTGKALETAVAEWVLVNRHLVRDGY